MDIKILVAAHKPYWMPDDDVYLPIQVGAAGKGSLGWQRDDEGDNISAKNPNYCELTALYWAWKNLNADYIGLCHYRRYFVHRSLTARMKPKKYRIYSRKDYENILHHYDVIIPTQGHVNIYGKKASLYEQYVFFHHKQVLDTAGLVIQQQCPEYEKIFKEVMRRTRMHVANMFVMKHDLFDLYCSWLFPILFSVEKEMKKTIYEDQLSREYGVLSEWLFNVWLSGRNEKKYEIPIKIIEETDIPWWRNAMYRMMTRNK